MDIFLIERRKIFALFAGLLYTGKKPAGETPPGDPGAESFTVRN